MCQYYGYPFQPTNPIINTIECIKPSFADNNKRIYKFDTNIYNIVYICCVIEASVVKILFNDKIILEVKNSYMDFYFKKRMGYVESILRREFVDVLKKYKGEIT
jgi:hypothetical protein